MLRSVAPSDDAAALRAQLLSTTLPKRQRSCEDVRPAIRTVWQGKERALGPIMHSMLPALWVAALTKNRTEPTARLLAPTLKALAASELLCGGARSSRTLECFVESLSSPPHRGCRADASDRDVDHSATSSSSSASAAASAAASSTSSSRVRVLRLKRDVTTPASFEYASRLDEALPAAFRSRGLFWLVSHTLRFLVRPNDATRRRLEQHERTLAALEPPVLAVRQRPRLIAIERPSTRLYDAIKAIERPSDCSMHNGDRWPPLITIIITGNCHHH